jgi:hypothetical protein
VKGRVSVLWVDMDLVAHGGCCRQGPPAGVHGGGGAGGKGGRFRIQAGQLVVDALQRLQVEDAAVVPGAEQVLEGQALWGGHLGIRSGEHLQAGRGSEAAKNTRGGGGASTARQLAKKGILSLGKSTEDADAEIQEQSAQPGS